MAVEATHITLLPPQIPPNRGMVDQANANKPYDNGLLLGYGATPISGTDKERLLSMYGSGIRDSVLKAESGLTCSRTISRKRTRDIASFNPLLSLPNAPVLDQSQRRHITFLGENVSMEIYQQQLEIDRFIASHTEKVRTEMEEMRKRNSRRLIAAAEEGIMKRLRAKEEQIVKIGKLNWALEEKLKSLSAENQAWRELAQTNEATANVLRMNLEQVLAQAQQHQQGECSDDVVAASVADDAQSCCGSNYEEDQKEQHHRQRRTIDCPTSNSKRWCRNCEKEESSVLLLPCRHLCICTVCASSTNICPVCKSAKTAGVHVNMT